jgi:hypothetical protein
MALLDAVALLAMNPSAGRGRSVYETVAAREAEARAKASGAPQSAAEGPDKRPERDPDNEAFWDGLD